MVAKRLPRDYKSFINDFGGHIFILTISYKKQILHEIKERR
jgi:hypothetical protein